MLDDLEADLVCFMAIQGHTGVQSVRQKYLTRVLEDARRKVGLWSCEFRNCVRIRDGIC